jgi:hypothetical protein
MSSVAIVTFAIAQLFGIARKRGVCSCILSPMRSKLRIVDIQSASFSGCVCPINIPKGRDSRLFPKISFERFFLEGCCGYSFDTLECVQRFGFQDKTRNSTKIKPVRSGSTITVVLVHSNMEICEGTDGYQIR